ncbi:MAG: amidohydrolase family protein [Candidatus Aminicenantes bacterium]|nr:amidohydrolase family protein [Candidatus Aminicenantes bacterium]
MFNSQSSKLLFRVLIVSVIISFSGCVQKKEPADLVLKNGKIVTVDEAKPEAQSLAVRGDKIVAVGSNRQIKPYIDQATKVIDLEGKLAIPGFIDAHGHFTSLGESKLRLDLMKVKNWDEIVAMVEGAVKKAKPGEWILGRGWHQEKWDKKPVPNVDGLPSHDSLSKVSPDNPVLLSHASGHASFANAKAMELAGITRRTQNPPGGEIVRDSKGNPIGAFRETAQRLLSIPISTFRETAGGLLHKPMTPYLEEQIAEAMEAEKRKVIELAVQECLSKGVTSFHDAGSSLETIDLFKELAQEGELRVRLYVMVRDSNENLRERLAEYKIIGLGENHLTVRAIKRTLDGALGSHGAWLLEPYEDLPSSVGLNTSPIEEITEAAQIAIENGFQICIHAIGDRANRETLDIFEEAFKAHPDKLDLRWRIEHSQHLHPVDIPRFGQLGVIASMQGIHCTSDGPWVIKRLGEKRAEEGAYVWQKLMKSGAIICNGTDVPVENIDPIACFYATVTRKLKDGTVFYSDQRMSREEALRSYTLDCAYAAFEEDIKGSLTPGKLADITILSQDIMTIPDDEILKTEVLYTIVGGKVMYQK